MSFNSHTKICPLQQFTNVAGVVTGIPCAQNSCEMWVPVTNTDEDSDYFSLNVATNSPSGVAESVEQGHDPANINQYHASQGGRCGMKTSDYNENIFRLTHHTHRHHEHSKGHFSCRTIPLGCGDYFFGTSLPLAFKLLQEVESDEDFDGNGKVFGTDFELDPTQDMPPVLVNILTNVNKNPPVRVSWANYKINKFPPYIKNIYPLKWNVNGGMRVRIIGGFFDGTMEEFEIRLKEKNAPAEDTGILIPAEDINVVNTQRLYFTVPAYTNGENIEMHLILKNSGDTFDMGGFLFDVFTDTGGETSTSDRKFYTTEEDDPATLQSILDDEATYATE